MQWKDKHNLNAMHDLKAKMQNENAEFKCRESKTYLKTTGVLPRSEVRLLAAFLRGDLLLPLSTWLLTGNKTQFYILESQSTVLD
jgi:hypothetical protein